MAVPAAGHGDGVPGLVGIADFHAVRAGVVPQQVVEVNRTEPFVTSRRRDADLFGRHDRPNKRIAPKRGIGQYGHVIGRGHVVIIEARGIDEMAVLQAEAGSLIVHLAEEGGPAAWQPIGQCLCGIVARIEQ